MKKGEIAGKVPQMVDLKDAVTYAWCACGKSANQPYCDGSHQGTDFEPKIFTVDKPIKAALCMCKQTNNPPYCDGSHNKL
ncbi:CDGSH iron-sulfur domain-containing protein [Saccharicrinis aurantiacus]|uniref:CDGSH iron-sulfur domain-containing protein n=1 Tax=Saccharicrinis aurantiacus TaxID=1849719 RepID=UPI0008399FF9|nr:CDGSH iron-sulfur domain-containing protein [Saccharicrinis aurantiacus]